MTHYDIDVATKITMMTARAIIIDSYAAVKRQLRRARSADVDVPSGIVGALRGVDLDGATRAAEPSRNLDQRQRFGLLADLDGSSALAGHQDSAAARQGPVGHGAANDDAASCRQIGGEANIADQITANSDITGRIFLYHNLSRYSVAGYRTTDVDFAGTVEWAFQSNCSRNTSSNIQYSA